MSQRNHPANQAKCVWVCAHVSKRVRERKDSSTRPVVLIILPQTAPMRCPCRKMKGALQCTWHSLYRLGPYSPERIWYLPEIPQQWARGARTCLPWLLLIISTSGHKELHFLFDKCKNISSRSNTLPQTTPLKELTWK